MISSSYLLMGLAHNIFPQYLKNGRHLTYGFKKNDGWQRRDSWRMGAADAHTEPHIGSQVGKIAKKNHVNWKETFVRREFLDIYIDKSIQQLYQLLTW